MAFFDRFRPKAEARDVSLENPATTLSEAAQWLWDALGARKATSGVCVTPENSLEVSALWAGVRVISSSIAALPLHVYERSGEGKQRAAKNPLYRLLHDRPNPEMSSFVFRELLMGHLLLFGNFYAEIEYNGNGEPIALWPIHPALVTVKRISDRKLYIVRVGGTDVPLTASHVIHVQGFSLDGCQGVFPVHLFREALGLAKATEQFGSSFFGKGATTSGVLSHPGKLGKVASENLRKSFEASNSGLTNAQRVTVLEEGVKFTPTQLGNDANQFLETRKFQVEEIARVLCIPPHLIGDLDRATFSNIEAQGTEFVRYCLGPWTTRISQELNFKLFPDSTHFAEFDLNGLMRGDSAARSSFYASGLQNGWLSVNEVRGMENLEAIEGGDGHHIQLNMQPLDQAEGGANA